MRWTACGKQQVGGVANGVTHAESVGQAAEGPSIACPAPPQPKHSRNHGIKRIKAEVTKLQQLAEPRRRETTQPLDGWNREQRRLPRNKKGVLPRATQRQRKERNLLEHREEKYGRQPVMHELPEPAVTLPARENNYRRHRHHVPRNIPRPVWNASVARTHHHRQCEMHSEKDAVGEVGLRRDWSVTRSSRQPSVEASPIWPRS